MTFEAESAEPAGSDIASLTAARRGVSGRLQWPPDGQTLAGYAADNTVVLVYERVERREVGIRSVAGERCRAGVRLGCINDQGAAGCQVGQHLRRDAFPDAGHEERRGVDVPACQPSAGHDRIGGLVAPDE